jgi:hypothetical protein
VASLLPGPSSQNIVETAATRQLLLSILSREKPEPIREHRPERGRWEKAVTRQLLLSILSREKPEPIREQRVGPERGR